MTKTFCQHKFEVSRLSFNFDGTPKKAHISTLKKYLDTIFTLKIDRIVVDIKEVFCVFVYSQEEKMNNWSKLNKGGARLVK